MSRKFRLVIERLPTITELVDITLPTISQQFLGFKKLSFLRLS